MSDFDWKETLAAVAPTIATALGGPFAGAAVTAAAAALGVEPGENAEQAVAEAVSAGRPETLLALRNADNKFKTDMKKLGVEIHKIDAQDRDSARKLGIERGVLIQGALSGLLTFAFVYVLFAIFEGEIKIDEGMRDVAIYALGTLNTILIQMMNYWFGSSSGSKEKSKELAQAIGKKS